MLPLRLVAALLPHFLRARRAQQAAPSSSGSKLPHSIFYKLRLLTDRRPRLVPLYASIVAAAIAIGFCRIADLDFWWHLATGKHIAATGSIPRRDIFSYTAAGRPYVDHEWLFQLGQHAVFSTFGAAGVMFLKIAIIALTFSIIGAYCARRLENVWAAGGLALFAMAGATPRLVERPELYSILFLVLTFIAMDSFSRSGNRRWLYLLPLVYIAWANIHAALIVGVIAQLVFIVGAAVERRRDVIVPLAITCAACVAAAAMNPFGLHVFAVPFELTALIESGIVENREWQPPTLRSATTFWFFLGAAALLMAVDIRRRRAATILLFVLFAYLSLRYVRNIGLFCAMAPMLIAANGPLRARWERAVAAAGVVAFLLTATLVYPFERGIGEASYFPDRLAAFVKRNDLRGNMYNTWGLGGYLIWQLYPERRVFMDGRNEVYEPLLARVREAEVDLTRWEKLLADYRVEYAIVSYVDELTDIVQMTPEGPRVMGRVAHSGAHFPRTRWALVDWDDDGMLFVRRGGANARLAATEYSAVYPEGPGYMESLVASGKIPRELAIAQLQRKLRDDPGSERARGLLASLAAPAPR
ncbi:MAG TPA: hypothetical protein VFM36_03410 [Thermoanaerobaculia bacterium]|nr:hypothetical protein [Thermoanaerobaculia bacterium]